jgi:hypothetical protein
MAYQIFNLSGVPNDEADGIRAILRKNKISFYETPTGGSYIAAPAIFLKHKEQIPKARKLINEYQKNLTFLSKKEYEKNRNCRRISLNNYLVMFVLASALITYFVALLYFH